MSDLKQDRANKRLTKMGRVISDKMQKTIVIKTGHKFREPYYGKVVERFEKFKVHDEKNEAKIGDLVQIQETRRLSKDKRWRLLRIVEKGQSTMSEVGAV